MSKLKRWLIALSLAVLMQACDPIYAIRLYNSLEQPVDLTVRFESGVESGGTLPPAQTLVFQHVESEMAQLTVSRDGQQLFSLDRQDMMALRQSVDDPSDYLWTIRTDGLEPRSREVAETEN